MSFIRPTLYRLGASTSVLSLPTAAPFRRYLLGQTLSGFGNALSVVALAFAVLAIDRSAAAVGVVMTASQVPKVLFVLLGGVFGDRYSRRMVMLSTDAGRSGLQAVTAGLLIAHVATVAEIAGLQAASGLGSAMFSPAANGLVKNLAPDGRNREATSLLGLVTTTASISGLAIAGALVAILGPGPAFAVDAATFAASTASLALIRSPALTEGMRARQPLVKDLGEGLRIVTRMRWLLVYCGYICLLNALALSPFFVLGPVVASRELGGAPAWAAIAIAWGIGSLLGSVIASRWQPHKPIVTAVALSTLIVPVLVGLAIALPLPLVIAAAVLAGLESTISNTVMLVALQNHVPDRLLARATAFEAAGTLIAAPLGMSLTGLTAGWLGTSPVLLFAAAWTLISSIVVAALPSVRALQGQTTPPLSASSQAADDNLGPH